VQSGVTTVIDQGGPSCMTLPGFRHFIAEPAKFEVRGQCMVTLRVTARDDIEWALRRYEGLRQPRTARVQRGARLNNRLYHFSWPVSSSSANELAVQRSLPG